MAIGSLGGGSLMKGGRRKAHLLSAIIGIVGILPTLYLNYYLIVIGRSIFGISVGIMSSVTSKYIQETVPNHLYDMLAPTFPFT